jgi:hypothetical protein
MGRYPTTIWPNITVYSAGVLNAAWAATLFLLQHLRSGGVAHAKLLGAIDILHVLAA